MPSRFPKKQDQRSNLPFAKKSFGQNFLVDQNYIAKIIKAASPEPGEQIIEIGPGRGALTEKLIAAGAVVTAIELEKDMIAVLREKFNGQDNFRLIEADALQVDFSEIAENSKPLKIVANLPYYISTAILQKLITERHYISEMILMFQREVVERIIARPGTGERGFLTVWVEAYLQTEKLFDVPPNAFRPAPKVWSSVVRLITKMRNENIKDEAVFRELISNGFAQRRKTILNNLKNSPHDFRNRVSKWEELLKSCQIDPVRRAETLTLEEWLCLANELAV